MKELIIIQEKLKAPKSQYNSFGKYNYRNCEDILEAVKPFLKETETYLTIQDDIVFIGARYYVKATARLYSSQGTIIAETSAFAREEDVQKGMNASQITGSASSYARKYALNGMFCIDDTKDADTTNTHGKEEPAGKPTSGPDTTGEKKQPKQKTVGDVVKKVMCPDNNSKLFGKEVAEIYCEKTCQSYKGCPAYSEVNEDEIPFG